MTLVEHLHELKIRLTLSVCMLVVAISISYFFADDIFNVLVRPLLLALPDGGHGRHLIFTGLAEAFLTKVKLAIFAGAFATFPIFAWHFYRFLAPGLFRRERRMVLPYLVFGPTLFAFGAWLAYAYIMPLAWAFFLSFEKDMSISIPVVLEARVSEYIGLVMSMVIAFGMAFQLPLVLVLLVQVGLLTAEKLVEFRRYAVVLIFIAAAIITPPDVLSQVALAIPLILLYEISIIVCKQISKRT